ncbi:MAG: nucleotidyltransferase domain-containing protein [Candidatus Aenigmatarchaeota archaeon]
MNKILTGYATSYVSFLLQNLDEKDSGNIKSIILFGSVARGTATPKSDIDIFIDILKNSKIKHKVEKILKDFETSDIYSKYWKMIGINNPIKIIVDSLENWPGLNESIWANGITLYGKYQKRLSKKENIVIFVWSKVTPETKRVHLSKKIYGWKYKGKKYIGLIEKTSSTRLGPNAILVPIEHAKLYGDMFKKFNITVKAFYASIIN